MEEENKDGKEDLDIIDFDLSLKKKKKKKVKNLADQDDQDKEESHLTSFPIFSESFSEGKDGKEDTYEYDYVFLLERVFSNLREKNPSLSNKKLIVPPPQLLSLSSKKTMIVNFIDIIKIINRTIEHVQSYFIAELNTNCNVDSLNRLIIKGKYNQRHIESIFKKYMIHYVYCDSCKKYNTSLVKDQITRLSFIKCDICNSTKSVDPIKNGYRQ